MIKSFDFFVSFDPKYVLKLLIFNIYLKFNIDNLNFVPVMFTKIYDIYFGGYVRKRA